MIKSKPAFCPVGIDAVEHDFSRAEGYGPLRPGHRFEPGWFAAAV